MTKPIKNTANDWLKLLHDTGTDTTFIRKKGFKEAVNLSQVMTEE